MASPYIAAALADLQSAFTRSDRARINTILRDLLVRQAELGDRWRLFADVLAHNGEVDLAAEAISRYAAVDPQDSSRRFTRAVVLARLGRNREAQKIVAALLAQRPHDPQLNHFSGALASEMGQFDEARHFFLRVLDRHPFAGQSWLELSAIHQFSDDDLLQRLRGALTAAGSPGSPEMRAPLFYALGKALDDLGDHDAAFAAFAKGAEPMAQASRYDAAKDRAEADAVIHAWTSSAAAPLAREPVNTAGQPIFVSGLPRSGTTLVEQMLSTNAQTIGGGELGLFSILSDEVKGVTPQAIASFVASNRSLEDVAALYRHLSAQRCGPEARVIDKTLEIGRQLGLVASAFPDAPIIWLRRDPLDAAWSCFRTYFAGALRWSWRQEDIARHFVIEDRLFEHWRSALDGRLLIVPYAELVANPEDWSRKIATYCGLPHDAAMLAPHLKQRAVRTSSVAQVRQPISTRAIGAGQRYRRHLHPFIDAYGYEG